MYMKSKDDSVTCYLKWQTKMHDTVSVTKANADYCVGGESLFVTDNKTIQSSAVTQVFSHTSKS